MRRGGRASRQHFRVLTETGPARVGLFGGTFDPPHLGHVAVAADVADHLKLDRVLWIPASEPPHKSSDGVSAADVRLEMVEEAVTSDPRFEISTLELERPGPSYTVDTVRAVRAELPGAEIFLIIGVDQFRHLDSWREPEEITQLARLAVMDREGDSAEALADTVPGGEEALFIPVRRIDISSTAIRAAVRERQDATTWVPSGVATIIEREGLYSAP